MWYCNNITLILKIFGKVYIDIDDEKVYIKSR